MGHAGGAAEMGPMSNTLVSSGNLFALKVPAPPSGPATHIK